MKLQVIIHPAEEGGFWAKIPAFAGCVSESETLEKPLLNIKEAAESWLELVGGIFDFNLPALWNFNG